MGRIPFGGSPRLTRVLGYWSQVLVMTGTALVRSPSEGPADLLGSHQPYAWGALLSDLGLPLVER